MPGAQTTMIAGLSSLHTAIRERIMNNLYRSVMCIAAIALLVIALLKPVYANDSVADVTAGAKAWAGNCSRCHNMRDPQEFQDQYWRVIVSHMRVRAGLTGQEARDILAFLQASNHPTGTQISQSNPVALPPKKAVSMSRADQVAGANIYQQTCVACHGADGKGALPGVADFTVPDGPLRKSDQALFQSILNGFQSPGSPLAMPAKGGNPNLSDIDIVAVIAHLRTTFEVKSASD